MSVTYPLLMHREPFETFVLGLKGVVVVRQWGDASVAKIGGKIFALINGDEGDIWFKASEMAFDLLTELDGIGPAPYLARAGWVAVSARSPLSEDEIRAYVVEAHRLVAGKLTRKVRAALGLG